MARIDAATLDLGAEPASGTPGGVFGFDDVIDVRSPSEFADDAIPGAVNLPVLSDAERAEVGALYVQVSKFEARKIGASLVARNIAAHVAGPLIEKPPEYRPLVTCWRGGQRSGAMAAVMAQIGWRCAVLDGGYRAYRRRVVDALYHQDAPIGVVLIDGPTGAGKTEVLRRVAALGAAVIDLEGLAAHRGSIFGAEPGRAQPSQKRFEGAVLAAITRAARIGGPVLVEAESSKIGDRLVPPALWKAMLSAPRITLAAETGPRARKLAADYAHFDDRPEEVGRLLRRLAPRCGPEAMRTLHALAAEGAPATQRLVRALIELHYDPAYAKSRIRTAERGGGAQGDVGVVDVGDLSAGALDAAAVRVAALLTRAGSVAPYSDAAQVA